MHKTMKKGGNSVLRLVDAVTEGLQKRQKSHKRALVLLSFFDGFKI